MDMNTKPPAPVVRNPQTHEKHRQEVFWQITLPILLFGLLALAAVVLPVVAVAQGGQVRKWADMSIIFLLTNRMIAGTFTLLMVGLLAYGVTSLLRSLPAWFYQVQQTFWMINAWLHQTADRSVEPVMRVRAAAAQLDPIRARFEHAARRIRQVFYPTDHTEENSQ